MLTKYYNNIRTIKYIIKNHIFKFSNIKVNIFELETWVLVVKMMLYNRYSIYFVYNLFLLDNNGYTIQLWSHKYYTFLKLKKKYVDRSGCYPMTLNYNCNHPTTFLLCLLLVHQSCSSKVRSRCRTV